MQHKCNRKLMGKKNRKKYPSQEIARKKIFDDQKSLPPPPSRVKWSAPKLVVTGFQIQGKCKFVRVKYTSSANERQLKTNIEKG